MIDNKRFETVPREKVSGSIEGFNFGYNLSCIARSPTAVLLWSSGTAYTSGRQTCYGASSLIGFPDRRRPIGGRLEYNTIGETGGRLSFMRIIANKAAIQKLFDNDDMTFYKIANSVRTGKTVLIEGGGPPLMPCRTLGPEAYHRWRSLPYFGFVNLSL